MLDWTTRLTHTSLQAPEQKTQTFQGSWVDVSAYEGSVDVLLHCSAATAGTNPTLDWSIEHADDSNGTNSTVYLASSNFTQVTNVASLQVGKVAMRNCKGFIRVVGTIAGTTPTFLVSASAIGVKKYNT